MPDSKHEKDVAFPFPQKEKSEADQQDRKLSNWAKWSLRASIIAWAFLLPSLISILIFSIVPPGYNGYVTIPLLIGITITLGEILSFPIAVFSTGFGIVSLIYALKNKKVVAGKIAVVGIIAGAFVLVLYVVLWHYNFVFLKAWLTKT